MLHYLNLPRSTDRRRELRDNATVPEKLLWSRLRGRQVAGYKFRRQHGIGSYIVDFYSAEARLVIEVDGPSHFETDEAEFYDAKRSEYLAGLGLRILRFTNTQAASELDAVVEEIWRAVDPDGVV